MRRWIQLAGSVSVHVAFLIVLSLVIAEPRQRPAPAVKERPLTWTATAIMPGERPGGGLGGNRAKASPAPRRPAADNAPRFLLPRMPDVLATLELPGVQVAFAAPNASGTGSEGPAGGKGEGRDGPGSGLRDGSGVGSGDGPFIDGAPGLTSPLLISDRRPEYTQEAMRARVQGTVLLEAVVLPDGSVGAVRVLRMMKPSLGLDGKAVEAVRAWRFRPGTYGGRAVPVKVLVELQFGLR